jgi:hypothetical protein
MSSAEEFDHVAHISDMGSFLLVSCLGLSGECREDANYLFDDVITFYELQALQGRDRCLFDFGVAAVLEQSPSHRS